MFEKITVFVLGMLPITELRISIPYGMTVFNMSVLEAFIWSVLGNSFIVIILLKILPLLVNFCFKHSQFLTHHIKKYFGKLHTKHSTKFNDFGAMFLAIFVAIPLPGTGAWTGSVLAYLFNIPFWLAFVSIALGVIGAGIIVAFFSGSIIELWQWL